MLVIEGIVREARHCGLQIDLTESRSTSIASGTYILRPMATTCLFHAGAFAGSLKKESSRPSSADCPSLARVDPAVDVWSVDLAESDITMASTGPEQNEITCSFVPSMILKITLCHDANTRIGTSHVESFIHKCGKGSSSQGGWPVWGL